MEKQIDSCSIYYLRHLRHDLFAKKTVNGKTNIKKITIS